MGSIKDETFKGFFIRMFNRLYSERTKILGEYKQRLEREKLDDGRISELDKEIESLMCFLKGSVKAFVGDEPPENQFGAAPWLFKNPICAHYHVDGCRNTEIRYLNGVATGFFQ